MARRSRRSGLVRQLRRALKTLHQITRDAPNDFGEENPFVQQADLSQPSGSRVSVVNRAPAPPTGKPRIIKVEAPPRRVRLVTRPKDRPVARIDPHITRAETPPRATLLGARSASPHHRRHLVAPAPAVPPAAPDRRRRLVPTDRPLAIITLDPTGHVAPPAAPHRRMGLVPTDRPLATITLE
jgi:hypothetical protein